VSGPEGSKRPVIGERLQWGRSPPRPALWKNRTSGAPEAAKYEQGLVQCWLWTGTSALGHEQTSPHVRVMSVIPLKADIHQRGLHVR
jgi:hypothetical protein